jgi:hypothetical protein
MGKLTGMSILGISAHHTIFLLLEFPKSGYGATPCAMNMTCEQMLDEISDESAH